MTLQKFQEAMSRLGAAIARGECRPTPEELRAIRAICHRVGLPVPVFARVTERS